MKWLWCGAKDIEPGNVALSGKIGIVAHKTNDQAHYITNCSREDMIFYLSISNNCQRPGRLSFKYEVWYFGVIFYVMEGNNSQGDFVPY